MTTTRVQRHINAPRSRVYRALLDADAVQAWMVPTGKTTAHTDTQRGRFVTLVPDERVVEVVEFETGDPALQGEMTITYTITYTLADAHGGTNLLAVHEGLPPGVPPADNEAGWRESLGTLAALVEASERSGHLAPDPSPHRGQRPGPGSASGRFGAPEGE